MKTPLLIVQSLLLSFALACRNDVLGGEGTEGSTAGPGTTSTSDASETAAPSSTTEQSGSGEENETSSGVGPTTDDPSSSTSLTTGPQTSSTGPGETGCASDQTTGDPDESECGDGEVTGVEECEDGNLDDFDGCSSACRIERRALVVRTGSQYTCALFDGGTAKCWGRGQYGRLGQGDEEDRGDEPGEMGLELPAIAIAGTAVDLMIYGQVTCAFLEDGRINCWGWPVDGVDGATDDDPVGDAPGEMGCALRPMDLEGNVSRLGPMCVALDTGELQCWADNDDGQLGLGDTLERGDDDDEMGASLPSVPVGGFVAAVDRQYGTTCALDDAGQLKCWGTNEHCLVGVPYGPGFPSEWDTYGDEPGELDALGWLPFDAPSPVVRVSVGSENVCAVFEDGSLRCWGTNMGDHFLTFQDGGPTWACGTNETLASLPAMDLGGAAAVDVAVGWRNGCVLFDDGVVKCWGNSGVGVVGPIAFTTGDIADVPPLDLGEPATQVSTEGGHACAILQSGYIKCWGGNEYGQLGYGDTDDRGLDPADWGDNLPYVRLF